ncbi:hypothetical protein OEM_08120 [Mycobacterium intracellulare subsp. yongonense 05-1390]|nr:hypothetical protein OEM_08120 [Mycobacterium intracellulare subsp. yongonense 05-1390]
MADAKKPPRDPATSKADTMALIEEAEAEAAEAEALVVTVVSSSGVMRRAGWCR